MQIKRILVPADFSEVSEAATRQAAAVARLFDASLILAHVYSPEVFRYMGAEGGYYVAQAIPTREEAFADARQSLERLVNAAASGLRVEYVVMEGDPAREIAEYAEQNRVELIVMPTRGLGAFRRFVLGSVAAKVLNDSNCPILTMTHGAAPMEREPGPWRNVACAVDLGSHSENLIRWSADAAAAVGASLHVIVAAPSVKVGGQDLGVSIREMLLEAVNQQVVQLLDKIGCQADVHVGIADVDEYVPEAARMIGADLLVIGRTSREGFIGRMHAHTYSLIRESPCPVVSL